MGRLILNWDIGAWRAMSLVAVLVAAFTFCAVEIVTLKTTIRLLKESCPAAGAPEPEFLRPGRHPNRSAEVRAPGLVLAPPTSPQPRELVRVYTPVGGFVWP